MNGAVAQSVEQRTENPCVAGSIPAHTTEQTRLSEVNTESLFLLVQHRYNYSEMLLTLRKNVTIPLREEEKKFKLRSSNTDSDIYIGIMEIICIEEPAYFVLMDRVIERIKVKDGLKEDKWISGEEAMKKLRITSKTTLQKLRDEGKIRFSQPEKKIILYDTHSINQYLEANSKDTFDHGRTR